MAKIKPKVKRACLLVVDIALLVYVVFAMTSFNNPDEVATLCTKVNIDVADKSAKGFLSAKEIKNILQREKLYPLEQPLADINPRRIEETLLAEPFVKSAECYKTHDGQVGITVMQRLPVVRIKSVTGDDYYIDERGGIMPHSTYTSDLIIVGGHVSRTFACHSILPIATALMKSDFWRNQIEQIYVRHDETVELVPRVGEHYIYLGHLPQTARGDDRNAILTDFIEQKMRRMEQFYQYGLTQAGWNKYYEINLEYDNQIICKKR